MTRHWYWRAFERLTKRPNVEKVAVQTNLSCRLDWLDRCDLKKVGLWATFHPSQITLDRFVDKIHRLHSMGVAHSVGMVGLREDFDLMETMRRRLPETTYLWINAYKSGGSGYYASEDIDRLNAIDPWFNLNNQYHPSHGRSCDTGSGVISVDGQGDIRRCHFVPTILGNLYRDSLNDILGERPCPNTTCGCHIGYVHLKHLQLDHVFADGILERIPVGYQIAMSPTNT